MSHEWIQRLTAQGFGACAVDLPCHGEYRDLVKLRHLGLGDYVLSVLSVLKTFRHSRQATLIGHSMGGLIAQAVVGRVPAQNLVLLASASPVFTGGINPNFLLQHGPVGWFNALKHGLFEFTPAHEQYLRGRLPKERYDEVVTSLQPESMRAVLDMMYGYRILERVQPERVLVVSGSQDQLMSMSWQRELARRYEAEHWIVNGGHILSHEQDMLEHSEELAIWIRG